jgi:hypothetical protein
MKLWSRLPMKRRIREWQALAAALVAVASLLWGWESALKAAAPAQAPVPAAGQTPSHPASTARQGEGASAASAEDSGQALFIEVKEKDRISASVKNRPLDQLLRIMSQKNLFEIKGPLPQGEAITVQFSNLTLEQALKQVMKGYNYALVDQGTSRKPVLMVMGPATGGASGAQGQTLPTPQPMIRQPQAPGGGPPAPPAPAVEQPGSMPPQRGLRNAPAPAQEGGSPPSQPQAPVAQPVVNQSQPVLSQPQQGVNQPQPGSPPGVTSGAPSQGEAPAGQPRSQQQPPAQGPQTGEAPVPGSMNDTLPKGF